MKHIQYNSAEDVRNFQSYTEKVAQHFRSDVMAEHYLNGFINWDGSPTQESIEAAERLEEHFGF